MIVYILCIWQRYPDKQFNRRLSVVGLTIGTNLLNTDFIDQYKDEYNIYQIPMDSQSHM